MSSKRLKVPYRCPGAKFECSAVLEGYIFKFNKKSKLGIGSGKGNLVYTGNQSDRVYGVIFEIPKSEEAALDEAEGYGKGGYEKKEIKVNNNGNEIDVFVYIAVDSQYIDNSEISFDWYKNHCIKGAIEFGLPKNYIDFLNSFDSKEDQNNKRTSEGNSIYSEK